MLEKDLLIFYYKILVDGISIHNIVDFLTMLAALTGAFGSLLSARGVTCKTLGRIDIRDPSVFYIALYFQFLRQQYSCLMRALDWQCFRRHAYFFLFYSCRSRMPGQSLMCQVEAGAGNLGLRTPSQNHPKQLRPLNF